MRVGPESQSDREVRYEIAEKGRLCVDNNCQLLVHQSADAASIAIHQHQNGERPIDTHWNNLLDTLLHTPDQQEDSQRQRHQINATESSEDKKGKLTNISANIHSLRPRANVIPTWEADVVALHETKLAPHAIAEASAVLRQNGYAMVHGLLCQPQTYRKDVVTTQAANEANSGGVAIVAKRGLKTITRSVQEQELELYDISRWMETKTPVSGRTKFVTVASFYGISGSASNEKKEAINEVFLFDAVKRAVKSDSVPYFMCGDININLAD